MMIKAMLAAAAFVIGVGVLNMASIGTPKWFYGLGVGTAIALVWPLTRGVSRFLSLLGVLGLVAVGLGAGEYVPAANQAFFAGASIGFLLIGWPLNAWLYWPRSGQLVRFVAERENERWLVRLVDRMGQRK